MESEGRVIVDAMNAMEYDAMTVGSMDLLKGKASTYCYSVPRKRAMQFSRAIL